MAADARQSARRTGPRATCPGRGRLLFQICVLLLLGLLCTRPARSAEVLHAPVSAVLPGAQIAVADFDGDLHPDSARIQTGSSDGARTSYCIRLELTSAGHQSIQVMGPIGGLEIAARDVNGDHAVDLVLTAAWFRQPVAILLNDGHGNFSQVDPSAYPGAFDQSFANWGAPAYPMSVAAVGPTQLRADVSEPARGALRPRPQLGVVPLPDSGLPRYQFLISYPCRAPPSGVSCL